MTQFEPYYIVIFTSEKSKNLDGYDEMNEKTFELVESQPGYLGSESFYNDEGRHVTLVRFKTKEDISNWKNNELHLKAQKKGKELWYDHYSVHICKVEKEYDFNR